MPVEIIPSILVQTEDEFASQVQAVENELKMVQLDIADGKFVPNTTWAEPDVVEHKANIDIELHLMVKNPLKELERWTSTEQIKRVLVHYESLADIEDALNRLEMYSWEIGLVLNPDTSADLIKPYLSDLQAVMFMGVYPGFQGQKLIPEVLETIKKFTSLHPNIFTSIDGAVNESTLIEVVKSGVNAICPGSAIFGNERTPKENIQRMNKIINELTE